MMSDKSALPDFFHALARVTRSKLLCDRYSIILYSTDASIYSIPPLAVFIPESIDDIQAAVEIAADYKIPILPRGAGTSLAGQAVNEALIIDFSRHCDHILEIDHKAKFARIQPGVVLETLNNATQKSGLKFGPDPASANRALMGGVIGNNATGSHSILYGMSVDHVQEMRVVLADGSVAEFASFSAAQLDFKQKLNSFEGNIYRSIAQIIKNGAEIIREKTPSHWRRCGGYNLDRFVAGLNFHKTRRPDFNLASLVCGAEGTLAVMTEIKVGLVPLPRFTALAVLHFLQHRAALEAAEIVMQSAPDVVELFDGWCLALAKNAPQYARLLQTFVEGEPQCLLIVEVSGDSTAEISAKLTGLREHLQKFHVNCTISEITSPQQQQHVWAVRKAGLGLLASRHGDYKPIPFIEDAAVPLPNLPGYIAAIEKFCGQNKVELAYYAHASAGCLHVRPFLNLKNRMDRSFMHELAAFSAELVRKRGGALSSEHGDGRSRSWLNASFFGAELYDFYCCVKKTFDPENLMNPGIITAGQRIAENLRFGENYRPQPVATYFSFKEETGFAGAVEMCTGAAVCKKLNSGTMCPSFMATREEKHSTRGRANALRAALATGLPESLDRELYEILDLCVECKACKAECPSKVDMAKLKFEFLSQFNAKNGIPLRSRLFAEIAILSRLFSGRTAGLFNALIGANISRQLLAMGLGISAKRKMPLFAPEPFEKWFAKAGVDSVAMVPKVVLFHDTFNSCSQPQVLIAATKILRLAGFEVLLSQHGCCGRSMISKGLFPRAKKMARTTVQHLTAFASENIPIVGLEPGCLLSLRDEYRDLLSGDPRVENIAANAFLFEEFIMQRADLDLLQQKLRPQEMKILLQGHCHQKALAGTAATKSFLELIPGVSCEEIDSACCGLAGSFGYEKEHYEISMAMGERRLFPAVRVAAVTTIIAAPGFSCRQQIEHGTGRKARHPVQIFTDCLKTGV